jgi:hypothetical protein
MQQRSQNSKKEEKNKRDGERKMGEKGSKEIASCSISRDFCTGNIKTYKLSCYISDIKVTRNGTNSFVQGI